MKLVVLPGLDGTGILLSEFVGRLQDEFDVELIAYPTDRPQTYGELADLVSLQLPIDEPYAIVAESFSGRYC